MRATTYRTPETVEIVGDLVKKRQAIEVQVTDTLDKIIRKMHAEHKGAVAVVDRAERFVGLITEKEILRRVFGLSPQHQEDALLYHKVITPETYTAWDVMIVNPECLDPNTDIETAFSTISQCGFRFMPVVNQEGILLGIASERELSHHAHQITQKRLESKDLLLNYFMHHESYGRGIYA